MKARILEYLTLANRKQRITLELDGDFSGQYDDLKNCEVAVEIKKFREKRSLDSNAYAWVLLDRLSAKLGIPRIELYRNTIKNIGGVSQTVCVQDKAVNKLCEGWEHNGIGWQTDTLSSKIDGCTNVILYYGSSTYDTAQMSRLIDLIVEDCKEVGIETLTPVELSRLTEAWNEQTNKSSRHT